ncbi:MAG: hypothetical protein IKS90_02640 [Clostridia bacterium]|nr:hypothetical protein [Clostridia bacterium]
MIKRTISTEMLDPVVYALLPTGEADIYLRKNVASFTDEIGDIYYCADEAYMRGKLSLYEIETDFDGAFALASAWGNEAPKSRLSAEERIAALEEEKELLSQQLVDTQIALCELYEMLGE